MVWCAAGFTILKGAINREKHVRNSSPSRSRPATSQAAAVEYSVMHRADPEIDAKTALVREMGKLARSAACLLGGSRTSQVGLAS